MGRRRQRRRGGDEQAQAAVIEKIAQPVQWLPMYNLSNLIY
ncbi:MAG: hypothetical protein AAFR22_14370 [Chloroflexota bacterium]